MISLLVSLKIFRPSSSVRYAKLSLSVGEENEEEVSRSLLDSGINDVTCLLDSRQKVFQFILYDVTYVFKRYFNSYFMASHVFKRYFNSYFMMSLMCSKGVLTHLYDVTCFQKGF